MNIYYRWSEDGDYIGTVSVLAGRPIPQRCTPSNPPEGMQNPVWSDAMASWVDGRDMDHIRRKLTQEVTTLRWFKETGGITVGGVRVLTSIEDQNRIATALIGAPATLDFKAESGWVTLTLAELQAIAAAITAHVQACFTAERLHHEAIDALTDVASVEAYDLTAGWPE